MTEQEIKFNDDLVKLEQAENNNTQGLSKREFKKSLTWSKKHIKDTPNYYKYLNLFTTYFNKKSEVIVDTTPQPEETKISLEDKKYIRRVVSNDTITLNDKLDILCDHYKVTEEEMKERINSIGMSLSTSQFAAAKLKTLKAKKRYIISSAQNASPVNLAFLNNIKAYAEFIDAEIGIIATRYRNPTSLWKEENDAWDVLTHPYLIASRQQIHKNLVILADLKVQATSPNPTSGIDNFEGQASLIVGSPRIEMRSVPTLITQTQKFLYSTGTVTVPNFTDSVAGGKQAESHKYGFIVVEIENEDVIHVRNVEADQDGTFNDLIYRVEDSKITSESTKTLVWGDSHFAQKEERVTNAFRKLCSDLGITQSVLHDIWDSQSLNVHNSNNAVVRHQLMNDGKDDLKAELIQMKEELKWFEKNMEKTIVVASNHDDMLDRAMYQGDWRDNLKNAIIFVDMLKLTLSGKAPNGVIPYTINNTFKNIVALGLDDSYIQDGVELALHGHKGSNGSKGSINQFGKMAINSIIGHSHSPAISGSCYQVGISCGLKHGYNKGLSSWAYSGCLLNKYGKRQLIVLNKDTLTYTTLY